MIITSNQPIRSTWVWASSGSWWWTGKTGVLQSTGSQRVRHDWVTELTKHILTFFSSLIFPQSNTTNPLHQFKKMAGSMLSCPRRTLSQATTLVASKEPCFPYSYFCHSPFHQSRMALWPVLTHRVWQKKCCFKSQLRSMGFHFYSSGEVNPQVRSIPTSLWESQP